MSIPRDVERTIHVPASPLIRQVGRAEAEVQPSVDDRRTASRVAHVHGPSVCVEIRKPDGTRLQGIVEDCCSTGAAVRFGYTDDPQILVDQVGTVVVTSPGLPELVLRTRVASAEPRVSGGTRYGLQFVDEPEVERQMTPAWRRWFSRRRWARFEPRDSLAATVSLEWLGGATRTRVVDASVVGLGVELDVESARGAIAAGQVQVLLTFPGSGGTMKLRANVRDARQGVPTVRVGLEFVRDPRFEAYRGRLAAWAERANETR